MMLPRRLLIAFFLYLNGSWCAAYAPSEEEVHEEGRETLIHSYRTKSPSVPSSRVKEARPIRNPLNSLQQNPLGSSPRTNVTLSEKLATLRGGSCDHDDFALRLRHQERLDEAAAAAAEGSCEEPHETSKLTWTLIGTAASFLVASTIVFSPSVVWKDAVSAFNAILSIHWIRTLSEQPVLTIMDVVFAANILARPGTIESLQKQVWPAVTSTVKTLFLAEMWSYFWKLSWKTWESFQTDKTISNNDEVSADSQPPTWVPKRMTALWNDTSQWMDGFVERGTRRILQKVLQKNIQDTFVRLASHGAGVFQAQWFSKAAADGHT